MSKLFTYDIYKFNIDPIYVRDIKNKIEFMLKKMIVKYNLTNLISTKYRYRLDLDKMMSSHYYKLYSDRVDINNKKLIYGADEFPKSFDEWIKYNMSDYYITSEIYTLICEKRSITQDKLLLLNEINDSLSD